MIFLEIHRDRAAMTVAELVSHEVGHLLTLFHAFYDPGTGFVADKDGIMGWQTPEPPECYKTWFDLVWGHTSPDRFAYQNIADLRSNASD